MRFIVALSCALMALPVHADPATEPDGPALDVRFPGAAVSALRGPTGFAEDPRFRAPTLTVAQASVRVELRPDLAIVEQTYTIENAGDTTRATLGTRQRGRDAPRGVAARPLAVSAYVDARAVPADKVAVTSVADGYSIRVDTSFPEGESVFSLVVVVQTVGAVATGGTTRPASRAPSELSVLAGYYAWDWTPDESAPTPPFLAELTTTGGLTLERVEAVEWSDGALRTANAIYWHRAPWLELRYDPAADARRAATWDELLREAQAVAARPPRGHVEVPISAEATERLGASEIHGAIDSARARRALIVPAFGLVLLLLAGYLYRRRKEQG